MNMTRGTAALTLLLFAGPAQAETTQQWREKREASLKADDGWLTVAGLIWLKEGDNPAPANAGVIAYRNGVATYKPKGAAPRVLKSDANGAKPDLIVSGSTTFFIIHRGKRDAIRVRDTQSELRKNFTGLHWYPVKPEYKVTADWIPRNPPVPLNIPNILGEIEKRDSPGYVQFKLAANPVKMDVVIEEGDLFLIFKDQTSGKGTYPAGRFLHAQVPPDLTKPAKVELDFNRAYNPPCAFTPYATCPLPPPQNRLAFKLEAGELNYGHH